jgi:hypothetical protein
MRREMKREAGEATGNRRRRKTQMTGSEAVEENEEEKEEEEVLCTVRYPRCWRVAGDPAAPWEASP